MPFDFHNWEPILKKLNGTLIGGEKGLGSTSKSVDQA